jgi:uncharacterized membrane protein YgcG
MLVFDPKARCTIAAALEHPYLAVLHAQMEEPLCHATFDFAFERSAAGSNGGDAIPRADLQAMMFGEMAELISSPGYARPAPPSRVAMGSASNGSSGSSGSTSSGGSTGSTFGGGGASGRADGKEGDGKMGD